MMPNASMQDCLLTTQNLSDIIKSQAGICQIWNEKRDKDMDKEVIRSVINDAIQEANNRAVEAYEKAVQEYYNHRGQYYEDDVYNLHPYVDSYGFIDERGNSMFPYDVRDNFSIP